MISVDPAYLLQIYSLTTLWRLFFTNVFLALISTYLWVKRFSSFWLPYFLVIFFFFKFPSCNNYLPWYFPVISVLFINYQNCLTFLFAFLISIYDLIYLFFVINIFFFFFCILCFFFFIILFHNFLFFIFYLFLSCIIFDIFMGFFFFLFLVTIFLSDFFFF